MLFALIAYIAALVIGWVIALAVVLWVAAAGMILLMRAAAGLLIGFGRFAIRARPR